MSENIRIVLVNTSHPGNIGGAARAMKNMGLSHLYLVEPEDFPNGNAKARASGADDILENARVVKTLDEALQGCSLVMGTSARDRRIPLSLLDPRESANKVLEHFDAGVEGDVALVFGREHSGLTNEELQRCKFHIHIPSNPEFSSLNLAAAVQVLVYELRMAQLARAEAPLKQRKFEASSMLNEQPASADEMERYFEHLEQVLIEVGFHDPQKPRHLMARLRRLYGRAEVNKLEMNILRGILTETQRSLRGEPGKRGGSDV
ncbi:tRNA (cytosine(32)/uridine(32)-2'-O)-methyltransferase TrmJ [Atopomonas sediminilitoris]|uniref:tRNA (cytosine(32)/uridine(32)-2'-O)-methyltransferase TrmJ n=1 Tax=Atopomonas sediminilitoris TaxID=2919919 RepID=UPI001F4D612F|nr:tRNA (cytosine(32)/uridine(32)-2'-O)-methyltransferase TrmJ [Atopomonas sediminilitoris]